MADVYINLTGDKEAFPLTIHIEPQEEGAQLNLTDEADLLYSALKKYLPCLTMACLWDLFQLPDASP